MGVGLREWKKARTRREIAGSAMQLFAQRGFDHVTVAEVAAAAGVSEKTVFNYFPTKEDLFFDEVPERRPRPGPSPARPRAGRARALHSDSRHDPYAVTTARARQTHR